MKKLIRFYKNENPVIQLQIGLAAVLILYSVMSCGNETKKVSTLAKQEISTECDWSTDREYFHTEGDFRNGSIWMISSKESIYRYWVSDGNTSEEKQLSGYDEALELSDKLIKKGYGCASYSSK